MMGFALRTCVLASFVAAAASSDITAPALGADPSLIAAPVETDVAVTTTVAPSAVATVAPDVAAAEAAAAAAASAPAVATAVTAAPFVAQVAAAATAAPDTNAQIFATNAPNAFAPTEENVVLGGTKDVAKLVDDAVNGDAAGVHAEQEAAVAEVPAATGKFVEGFIAKYFATVTLEPGEKACIEVNAEGTTTAGVGIISTLAHLIADLVAKKAPNPMMGFQGVQQIITLVTKVQTLVKTCIRDDVVGVMNQTLAHLKNPTYVQGRVLANGIDIAKVLADSIPSYEQGNFEKVGGDFGTLLRKILLSRNSGTTALVLPEGMDKAEVGEDVANGVIAGLFVSGTSVTITEKDDPTVYIKVDLHACIALEAPYFSAAMNALYLGIAQITTNIEQWQLSQRGIQTGYIADQGQDIHLGMNGAAMNPGMFGGAASDSNWMNHLEGLMTNIPTLMMRCGFTEEDREMMTKALKAMDEISMAFTIPGPPNRATAADMAAIKFENATVAWQEGKFKWFGFYLGGLMRDLLLTVYPEQYHVDNGQLKAFVDTKKRTIALGDASAGSLTLFIGGFAAFMLVGLALVRVARPRQRDTSLLQSEVDMGDVECNAVE